MELDFDKFKRSLIISKNDKYAFLLGAGSSITSGIQSAYDCIWEWKKMIYQTSNNISNELIENFRNKKNQEIIQNWLDNQGRFPPNGSEIEYSFYANECFPIDEDRRKYFQKICSNAQPSIGYKATALLAKSGFVDTVWTTNFDDLMRDACISQRFQSIDITLENTSRIINRAQNNSELPILKLHGDFKFGDLKNTESELKTQDEVFREKMIEYLKDKHLIVFGYSGRDHSLMNTLRELYSKDGGGRLYWCGYKENKSEVVKDLILSANEIKTRAFYIATEGFDNAIYQIAQLLLSDNLQIYNEFEALIKDDSKKIESIPFNLLPKKTNTVLKSNFFPIEFPKEVYVFEHTIIGKTWDFLNENILPEKGIAAVPIGNQIWSLGIAENISKLFGSFIHSKLVRKPITEITNNSNNLIYLFLSAICKYYSVENNLLTDNNRKLWNVNDFTFIKGHKVYSAIRLNIEIISNQFYITLNPDFHVDSKDEIHAIGLEYFREIWNKKFNEYVSKWRGLLFKNSNGFDFPNNSNSGFTFKISKNPIFTLIDDLTRTNSEQHSVPAHLIKYRGVKFKEPNLIFSSNNGGKRCLEPHPMKGLVNHKPYETGIDHFLNKDIKMSVLCVSDYSQKLNNFLNKLNTNIPVNNPKESYLVDYEGFETIYNVNLEIPDINSSDWREIEDLELSSDIKSVSNRIKENICSEILKISASRTQKVIVIFIPNKWLKYTSFSNDYESFDLHDYIKAFCAEKGLTSQFITEKTLLDNKQECQVVWWLSLSFYVKSFRTPWLVENSTSDTAFAGIGYSIDKFNKNNPIILGCSHLYTSNGEGLKYKLSKLSNDKIQWREPRLIFRDTIQNNLIGPGSDIFVLDSENEIISDYPLSRYYSGILFPERDTATSIGEKETFDANAEIEDDNLIENLILSDENKENINEEEINKTNIVDPEKEYSEANQYFPTNFGLTFCVPKETKSIDVTFNYAKYIQIEPVNAVIEIEEKDYRWFVEHPYNYINNYFKYEKGQMSLNKEVFEKGDLDVRNFRQRFKEEERQAELLDSIPYKKAELLLGRLWKRIKREPVTVTLNLQEINADESVAYPIDENQDDSSIITCYYKKIYETDYGKFIKILLANRLNHPKNKFSFGNEQLNSKAIFQAEIKISGTIFKPYKQLAEINPFDEELNLINFQYREEYSFGIGHGCAVTWANEKNPTELKTTFLPEVDIKNYSNAFKNTFPEDLKEITTLKKLSIWTDLDKSTIIQKLKLFAKEYKDWIVNEQETAIAEPNFKKSLDTILDKQNTTYSRLVRNIKFLESNEVAFKSFQTANTAMYIQMLISNKDLFGKKGIDLSEIDKNLDYNDLEFFKNHSFNPNYRPFQLAFFLLNLESIINEDSDDRNNVVDLLWFPTGGGKTEAYLAITAFTIISRRILYGTNADGVSVIMRYTLRLLTAQQFERATKLILSLDFLRRNFQSENEYFFGNEKVSIGMWVGASTTPNSYKDAKKICNDVNNEIVKLNNKKEGNYQKANTFPVTSCAWCGCNLVTKNQLAYYDSGYSAGDKSFSTHCLNSDCAFSEELPIYFVDDKIYNFPPTLLFATVDKFAMLSHREEGHRLFNSVLEEKDKNKLPPDLIIQDELHLLSGPLGSITGLYESIVEMLSTKGNRKPKIITSTATTRNTEQQVAMLYGNRSLNIFPPMGVTYDDNFFSYISDESKRKHIGFMPTGKTALNSQIRMLGNLLLARIELFKYFREKEQLTREEAINKEDNFWTIVSFYNSLRDVGKIYNKVPAEILDFLKLLNNRYQLNKQLYGFNYFGLSVRTKELTSGVTTFGWTQKLSPHALSLRHEKQEKELQFRV